MDAVSVTPHGHAKPWPWHTLAGSDMVSSVFNHEMMLSDRRWRVHRLRWIYAGIVLVQLIPLFRAADTFGDWLSGSGFAEFFERFLVVHFGLIALVTPAVVAGAITEEKTTGTLQYLLTAHLSPFEIVVGKFLARGFHLAVMSLAGLPIIALLSGFGGVGQLPVALLFLSLGLVFGLSAASILASVCCRQTRDAMLWTYLLGLLVCLILEFSTGSRLTAWADRLLPLRALTLEQGRVDWSRIRAYVVTWSVIGTGCLVVASLRLRGAYLRQLRGATRVESRWWSFRRPRIGVNPVWWRERHVVGVAPLSWLRRWPRWLGCVAIVVGAFLSLSWALQWALPARTSLWSQLRAGRWLELREALAATAATSDVFYWHGLAALLVASLVVAIRASGAITEEREHSTWEAVLLTPLTTRTILRGKQWGILGGCLPYLLSYGVTSLTLSLLISNVAAAWTAVWLVMTVFAGLFAAAVGIACSVRMRGSWQSLLVTLLMLYGGWILLTGPTAIGAYVVHGAVAVVIEIADDLLGLGSAVGVVQLFEPIWLALGLSFVLAYFLTHRLMISAEKVVARRERARAIDPQNAALQAAWFDRVMKSAGAVAPTDDALLQPVPLPPDTEQSSSEHVVRPGTDEQSDLPLPVPPALNPLLHRKGKG